MQQEWRVGWGEISVGNEENVTAKAKEAQRHHCLHVKRDEYESGPNIPQQICFACIEKGYAHVENSSETSVGRIVTEPDQESTAGPTRRVGFSVQMASRGPCSLRRVAATSTGCMTANWSPPAKTASGRVRSNV